MGLLRRKPNSTYIVSIFFSPYSQHVHCFYFFSFSVLPRWNLACRVAKLWPLAMAPRRGRKIPRTRANSIAPYPCLSLSDLAFLIVWFSSKFLNVFPSQLSFPNPTYATAAARPREGDLRGCSATADRGLPPFSVCRRCGGVVWRFLWKSVSISFFHLSMCRLVWSDCTSSLTILRFGNFVLEK